MVNIINILYIIFSIQNQVSGFNQNYLKYSLKKKLNKVKDMLIIFLITLIILYILFFFTEIHCLNGNNKKITILIGFYFNTLQLIFLVTLIKIQFIPITKFIN